MTPAQHLRLLKKRRRLREFERRGHDLEISYLQAKSRGDRRRMDELATAMVDNSRAMLAFMNSSTGARRAPVRSGFMTRDMAHPGTWR